MIKKAIVFLRLNFKGTDIPAFKPAGITSSKMEKAMWPCKCACCYNCGPNDARPQD